MYCLMHVMGREAHGLVPAVAMFVAEASRCSQIEAQGRRDGTVNGDILQARQGNERVC